MTEATQRFLILPLAFIVGLAGLALLPPVRQNPNLLSAFLIFRRVAAVTIPR